MFATLCINLDRDTARWQRMQDGETPLLPPELQPIRRVSAVDGRTLDIADPALPVSARCRQRLRERWRLCNGLQIDSVGALGCTLSHLRCWRWLQEHRNEYAGALILEDDCRLTPGFAHAWVTRVGPMLRRACRGVDWVVLGYRCAPKRPAPAFEGTHCYALTPAGADNLCAHVFPVQLHVDAYLWVLRDVGLAPGGRMWRESLASQAGRAGSTIGHFELQVGYKRALADKSSRWLWSLLALVVLWLVLVACRRPPPAR